MPTTVYHGRSLGPTWRRLPRGSWLPKWLLASDSLISAACGAAAAFFSMLLVALTLRAGSGRQRCMGRRPELCPQELQWFRRQTVVSRPPVSPFSHAPHCMLNIQGRECSCLPSLSFAGPAAANPLRRSKQASSAAGHWPAAPTGTVRCGRLKPRSVSCGVAPSAAVTGYSRSISRDSPGSSET